MLHRRNPRHAPSKLDTRPVRLGMIAAITALLLSGYALGRSPRGLELLGFLDFYVGVIALMMLTATVALGLVATERVFLSARYRVYTQYAHRITAMAGMAALATHVALKIDRPPVLGAVAAGLLVISTTSGLLRGMFAGSPQPWVWRTLHSCAYLAWPIAVLHGLTAGRPAAAWVTWAYAACLAAVGAALTVRVLATLLRPPALPEMVEAPLATGLARTEPAAITHTEPAAATGTDHAAPVQATGTAQGVGAPVSLDEARRKYRSAG